MVQKLMKPKRRLNTTTRPAFSILSIWSLLLVPLLSRSIIPVQGFPLLPVDKQQFVTRRSIYNNGIGTKRLLHYIPNSIQLSSINDRATNENYTGTSNSAHLFDQQIPQNVNALSYSIWDTPQHAFTSRLSKIRTQYKTDGFVFRHLANSNRARLTRTTRTTTTSLWCQLLGMNCASESEFVLGWNDFCERGGGSDVHKDGWGLAYYIGNGIRQFHDIEAASTSPLAKFIGSQQIQSRNLLAHIRYATTGSVNLANVHPFCREMWAVNWCFCHNGEVPLFKDHPNYWLGGNSASQERFYYPVGTTDSEATFCAILNALRAEFPTTMPSLPVLYEKLKSLCTEIINYNPSETILNFLLACGPHVLWVYSWPGKRPGSKVWNGLYYSVRSQSTRMCDSDYSVRVSVKKKKNGRINGASSSRNHTIYSRENDDDSSNSNICIVATKPLTDDDDWVELEPGELLVMNDGVPNVTPTELFRIELQGHGIQNDGKVLNPPKLQEDMRRYAVNPEFFVASGI